MSLYSWSARSLAGMAVIALIAMGSAPMPRPAHGQAPTPKQIEKALFDNIMSRVPRYAASRRDRALAVCIDWEAVTLDHVPAYFPSWSSTAEGSDVPVFMGRLMRSALEHCKERRKQAGTRCDCVKVAKWNKSVLRVPDAVMKRLSGR